MSHLWAKYEQFKQRRLGVSAQLLALAAADGALFVVLTIASDAETAMLVISFRPEPHD